MKLHILGMNGPYPAPGGATSGYLVTGGADGAGQPFAVQLDLGTGTLAALTAKMPPEELTALVFSHWHYDHCSDALPLLYRLQATGKTLEVWGPEDGASPVRAALAADHAIRLHTLRAGDTVALGGLTLTAFTARHPVPALMLRLTDGARTLCYTGDTNTVDGLDGFAAGADLLLADGLFTDAAWGENKPHLSARMTAELANRAGVRRLVITHLNPSIPEAVLLREAREARGDAALAACGQVWDV